MRKLGILGASLFLALAVPASAQDLKDEVGKVATAYEQHFNQKDAAGITSLYTKNYLRVNSAGVVADNTKLYEVVFKGGFDHLEGKITEIQPLNENMALATGESKITGKNEKGEPMDATVIWTNLLVRENGAWKIRMLTSFPKPSAPPQQASK